MQQRLHITDGDAAADKIGALVRPEPVLPWRDMLHEGPVPKGLGLEALSAERARFLAARFRLDPARTEAESQARDQRLRAALAAGEGFVLWFGPDLYDQLQLVQLLALIGAEGVPAAGVRLVQADTDLAEPAPDALAALGAEAAPASLAQLELARDAWAAFCAPTPERLAELHEADTSALPWLAPALERLLEELPTDYPGLSRTERYILEELEPGPLPAGELYARCRARERVPFMADWPFFALLDELAAEPSPLVAGLPVGGFPFEGGEATRSTYLGTEVRVTHQGRLVREGRLDRTIVKPLDRWLGGTHLTGENVWRWVPSTATLERG
jgi:hypothetical protein